MAVTLNLWHACIKTVKAVKTIMFFGALLFTEFTVKTYIRTEILMCRYSANLHSGSPATIHWSLVLLMIPKKIH